MTQITTATASPCLTPFFFLWGHPLEENPASGWGRTGSPSAQMQTNVLEKGEFLFDEAITTPGKGTRWIRAGLSQSGSLGDWNWLFRENPERVLFRKQKQSPRAQSGALCASRDPVQGLPSRRVRRSRGAGRFAPPAPYLPPTAGDPEAILCRGPRVARGGGWSSGGCSLCALAPG